MLMYLILFLMLHLEKLEIIFNVEVFQQLTQNNLIIYSFSKYLDISQVPGIVPGGRDTMVNKIHTVLGIRELADFQGRQKMEEIIAND